MASFGRVAVFAVLVIAIFGASQGNPIEAKDVESLLPDVPRTKNETVAAIVQDTVVQDAVQTVVGEGSLNGLVVKKNIVILPAEDPNKVLTQAEQILRAPTSHLEDIRKNISETASKKAEVPDDTIVSVVIQQGQSSVSDFVSATTETTPRSGVEQSSEETTSKNIEVIPLGDLPQITTTKDGQGYSVPGIDTEKIKLPSAVSPLKLELPQVINDKLAVPVLAVLNPVQATDDSVQGNVIALLPSPVEQSTLKTELDFLNHNHEKISEQISTLINSIPRDVQETSVRVEAGHPLPFLEQPFLAFRPTNEVPDNVPEIEARLPSRELAIVIVPPESNAEMPPSENILAVYESAETRSRLLKDPQDMEMAEDIIFRPLFRFHQRESERSRLSEDRTYKRRSSFRQTRPPYRAYSTYDRYGRPYGNQYSGY